VKIFLYPNPLHYSIIPELCYDQNATIILGTDTFFKGYARKAHPYDFQSIRYAIGGAEKIKDETRKAWFNKFGVRIIEGYGATEAAPLIAFNNPMEFKLGTVGKFIAGMEYKLEETEAGNKLLIKGPNMMMGYLKADNPGVLQPLEGWYDTGDIVEVDDEGFLKIVGRAKRFAKIGGEMVSLLAVEDFVLSLW
jgi:acyl-[acyl-carrier-protein]-phospholipid O-acyltransferase/long-chain-fatty-acid--[acyl-carrier-protein] ligase